LVNTDIKKKLRGFAGLSDSVVGLGVAAIVIAFVALVLAQIKTQVTSIAGANSAAENATTSGLTAMQTFGTWLPIIAIVTVAGVILSLLYFYMMGRARQG
jgi:hypothetical protein